MNNYPYHKLVRDMPKLYESWPGNNRFWFGGISGPARDMGGNIYIYLCILGAVIPFSIVMFDIVWKENPVLPILFYVMTALAIVFLNLTTYTDPGIIPRRPYI